MFFPCRGQKNLFSQETGVSVRRGMFLLNLVCGAAEGRAPLGAGGLWCLPERGVLAGALLLARCVLQPRGNKALPVHGEQVLCLWTRREQALCVESGSRLHPSRVTKLLCRPTLEFGAPRGRVWIEFLCRSCMCCLPAPSCFPPMAVAPTGWKKATRKTILVS